MSSSRHPRTTEPSDADLERDPGIGSSRGATGADREPEGENTFEGDVLNDTTPEGGIGPDQRGRENK